MKKRIETKLVHLCVRAERCPVPLFRHEVAEWLWTRLRRAFPESIAAVIMPDHIHLLTPAVAENAARLKLAALISGLSRSSNPAALNSWGQAYAGEAFVDPRKILRQVRYIVLNPARDGLVNCPLEWVWSTHRDVMGAVSDPWVTSERMAALLGMRKEGFADRHHLYVSGDPSTRPEGTPLSARHDRHADNFSLVEAKAAALASVRGAPDDLRANKEARRQLLALAKRAGWAPKQLAAELGLSAQRTRACLRDELDVAPPTWACLGDARLRTYLIPHAHKRAG